MGQHNISAFRDPLRTQHGGLDLVGGKHERRHVEVARQDIPEARLARDRHPLTDQIGDIAVDGPLRHLQLLGQRARGDGLGGSAENLDDLE